MPTETQHQMASHTTSNLSTRHLYDYSRHLSDDEFHSSTIKEQIDFYFSTTALILNEAIQDFEHDHKQLHDRNTTTDQVTDSILNHPNEHMDSNPSYLHTIDSHPADTRLILDNVPDNPCYATAQHPPHTHSDQHATAAPTTPLQQNESIFPNPHADQATAPQRRITRSMTTAAHQ